MAPPGIKVSVVVNCLHRCWCGILGLRGRYREGGVPPWRHGCLMPTMFHSTPITMRDDVRDHRWIWRRGLPASLVLHLLIAVLLIFGLPESLPQPQEDQAISV